MWGEEQETTWNRINKHQTWGGNMVKNKQRKSPRVQTRSWIANKMWTLMLPLLSRQIHFNQPLKHWILILDVHISNLPDILWISAQLIQPYRVSNSPLGYHHRECYVKSSVIYSCFCLSLICINGFIYITSSAPLWQKPKCSKNVAATLNLLQLQGIVSLNPTLVSGGLQRKQKPLHPSEIT